MKFKAIRNYESGRFLTKGKVYDLVNNKITYDNGTTSTITENSFFREDDEEKLFVIDCLELLKSTDNHISNPNCTGLKKGSVAIVTGHSLSHGFKIGTKVTLLYDPSPNSSTVDSVECKSGCASYYVETSCLQLIIENAVPKVGDRIIITKRKHCHGMNIGHITTLTTAISDENEYVAESWMLSRKEFEVIQDVPKGYIPTPAKSKLSVVKVGSKLKITNLLHGHEFKIGEIVTVEKIVIVMRVINRYFFILILIKN